MLLRMDFITCGKCGVTGSQGYCLFVRIEFYKGFCIFMHPHKQGVDGQLEMPYGERLNRSMHDETYTRLGMERRLYFMNCVTIAT